MHGTPQDVRTILHDLAHEVVATSQGEIPGVTLSIVCDQARPMGVAAGVADKERCLPMTPACRMLSASTGKTFVAATLLTLQERGNLDLDAELSSFLGDRPWFRGLADAANVTVRMLLNHTSGLRDHLTEPEFLELFVTTGGGVDFKRRVTPPETVALLAGKPGLSPSGESFNYSDTNYILAGLVIEEVTGAPYESTVTRLFLEPLGLSDTVPLSGFEYPALASGYSTDADPLRFGMPRKVAEPGRLFYNAANEWTGGGFVTSASDLARWAANLWGGRVHNASSLEQMFASGTKGDAPYGLGVMIRETELGRAYFHPGFSPGYSSLMAFYREPRIALALMANNGGKALDLLAAATHKVAKVVAATIGG